MLLREGWISAVQSMCAAPLAGLWRGSTTGFQLLCCHLGWGCTVPVKTGWGRRRSTGSLLLLPCGWGCCVGESSAVTFTCVLDVYCVGVSCPFRDYGRVFLGGRAWTMDGRPRNRYTTTRHNRMRHTHTPKHHETYHRGALTRHIHNTLEPPHAHTHHQHYHSLRPHHRHHRHKRSLTGCRTRTTEEETTVHRPRPADLKDATHRWH
jgi:hypothetical protein